MAAHRDPAHRDLLTPTTQFFRSAEGGGWIRSYSAAETANATVRRLGLCRLFTNMPSEVIKRHT